MNNIIKLTDARFKHLSWEELKAAFLSVGDDPFARQAMVAAFSARKTDIGGKAMDLQLCVLFDAEAVQNETY
jgi:hypothetical protein